ncbi:MAG: hypothetical protein CMP65_00630 [Flavobacteriales bacterium]|nr:hypothetical protein [Flavobacteriales bacterium]|tara:strand:- start:9865 stop:11988 length:2124 start_codon:yes stop_codon:yes gene_type:complete
MSKLLNINVSILVVLLFFLSCNIENIELENDNWSPELVAPLINSTITIGNLIPEQENTIYDDDNFIRLAFRDDSLFKLEAQSFVSIQDEISFEEQFLLSDLDISDFNYSYNFLLGDLFIEYSNEPLVSALIDVLFENSIVPSPFYADIQGSLFNNIDESDFAGVDLSFVINEFQSIYFENGFLNFEIENNLPLNIDALEVAIINSITSEIIATVSFTDLFSNSSNDVSIDLSNKIVSNEIELDILNLEFSPQLLSAGELPFNPESGLEMNFSITDINVYSITMPFNNQVFDVGEQFVELDLDDDASHQIHNIELSNGQINYSINSSINTDLKLKFSIPSATQNGQIFTTEPLQLSTNSVGSIDISNLELDLTTNPNQEYNFIPISAEIIINSEFPIELNPTDFVEFSFSFSNLEVDYIDGYFDTYNFDLGSGVVNIDLSLLEDFDSGLKLEDPSLTINISNSLGIGANVNGQLYAYAEDGAMAFFEIDTMIDRANIQGESILMQWIYGKDVIGDIIELPPKTLEYQAEASIINDGNINFLTKESALFLGFELDFPLSVNAANISLRDTIKIDEIKYDDISKIKRIILHYNFINGFPLGTEFDLVLRDSLNIDGENLDTIQFIGINSEDNIFEPAEVNQEGYVVSPTLNSGFVPLTNKEISSFLNTNQIIIDVTLSSSNYIQENQFVKIFSDQACVLKLGVETQIDLN